MDLGKVVGGILLLFCVALFIFGAYRKRRGQE